jgi:redox-sensing transcriptional repressor
VNTAGQPLHAVRVSESTVRRLSGYYRILGQLREEEEATVSSFGLARRAGVTPAQVRKDLSFFGHFGKRGTGYSVSQLEGEIRCILGLDRRWRVCLVGAGNLAHALFAYKEFEREGFETRALLDNDPNKIGRKWDALTVEPVERLGEVVKERGLEIGIITTPAEAAQEVVDLLIEAGIRGILNFASRKLFVPEQVNLRNVNLAIELESLSFALK